jgi:hypothetical protein
MVKSQPTKERRRENFANILPLVERERPRVLPRLAEQLDRQPSNAQQTLIAQGAEAENATALFLKPSFSGRLGRFEKDHCGRQDLRTFSKATRSLQRSLPKVCRSRASIVVQFSFKRCSNKRQIIAQFCTSIVEISVGVVLIGPFSTKSPSPSALFGRATSHLNVRPSKGLTIKTAHKCGPNERGGHKTNREARDKGTHFISCVHRPATRTRRFELVSRFSRPRVSSSSSTAFVYSACFASCRPCFFQELGFQGSGFWDAGFLDAFTEVSI